MSAVIFIIVGIILTLPVVIDCYDTTHNNVNKEFRIAK